jgi:hypothetical protein
MRGTKVTGHFVIFLPRRAKTSPTAPKRELKLRKPLLRSVHHLLYTFLLTWSPNLKESSGVKNDGDIAPTVSPSSVIKVPQPAYHSHSSFQHGRDPSTEPEDAPVSSFIQTTFLILSLTDIISYRVLPGSALVVYRTYNNLYVLFLYYLAANLSVSGSTLSQALDCRPSCYWCPIPERIARCPQQQIGQRRY